MNSGTSLRLRKVAGAVSASNASSAASGVKKDPPDPAPVFGAWKGGGGGPPGEDGYERSSPAREPGGKSVARGVKTRATAERARASRVVARDGRPAPIGSRYLRKEYAAKGVGAEPVPSPLPALGTVEAGIPAGMKFGGPSEEVG
jgi:hypothetical protein